VNLATKVLIGLGLGVATGLFLGELVSFLGIVGEAFVQLLQMTVLPYVMVSLITALGRLSYQQAGQLAVKCGAVLLLLWGVTIGVVMLLPLAFPNWESASFFSTSLVQKKAEFDFLGMYIPANPFRSLAEAVVPAVVLFSLAIGLAMIGLKNKEPVLTALSPIADALTSIANFVVSLAPYGVFAIAASAAGTMTVEEFGRLQIYVFVYIGLALVLAFWVLPGLITVFTPLSYKQVLRRARGAVITAFATGSVFVVLPLLAERSKELLQDCDVEDPDVTGTVDVVVPTGFNFPSTGAVLSLSFVLFAGWASGSVVSVAQYPMFAVTGILSAFGGLYIAVPFLLDLLRVPADTFELFVIVNNMVNSRFGSGLAAIHILAVAVIGACAMAGRVQVQWSRLARYGVISAVLLVAPVLGTRLIFTHFVKHEYKGYQIFVDMDIAIEPAEMIAEPSPSSEPDRTLPVLERIQNRGALRVGYFRDMLPFVFQNTAGRLVGFDAEMAHILARELDAKLEFVLVERARMAQSLADGECDIIMSGVAVTTGRSREVTFSEFYQDQTFAFMVEDHRREEFGSRESVKAMDSLTVGVLDVPYYVARVQRYVPHAKLVVLDSPRQFFRKEQQLDAMGFVAEAGSAWTLVYPSFSVAIPMPDLFSVPLAYAMPKQQPEWHDFIDTWVRLKRKDGTTDRLYERWILGRNAVVAGPRWSVIKDVLHWID
jgi:Na+/H+-dicarboxylate symporter